MRLLWVLIAISTVSELGFTEAKTCQTEKCCGQKKKCSKLKGSCQPNGQRCDGRSYVGKKYCKLYKDCHCCVEVDCAASTLDPCKQLGGKCIGVNEKCDGCEVPDGSKNFCKDYKTCKCCFPACNPGGDECYPEKDKCTENGAYCARLDERCKEGFEGVEKECVSRNGPCQCCKPIDKRNCPAPFKKIVSWKNKYSEYLYFHDTSRMNWDDAQNYCKSIGGSLAEPENMDDFINLIDSSYSHMKNTIWLGATDRTTEQDWKWLSGGAVPSSIWPISIPPTSPWTQPSGDGDCLEIHHHSYTFFTGFFVNDWWCSREGYFVCECTPQIIPDDQCYPEKDKCTEKGAYCAPLDKCCGAGYAGVEGECVSRNGPCQCCKPINITDECYPECGRCNEIGAYCEKLDEKCKEGYIGVEGECGSRHGTCQCCKPIIIQPSDLCLPHENQCTGKGEYCADTTGCPEGYSTYMGYCKKPDGKACGCCVPKNPFIDLHP